MLFKWFSSNRAATCSTSILRRTDDARYPGYHRNFMRVVRRIAQVGRSDSQGGPDDLGLTPAERRVVELVALGLQDKEIASRLVLSVRTVHKHVSAALKKTGGGRRTELANRWNARTAGRPAACVWERIEVSLVFREGRLPQQLVVARTLRANVDGLTQGVVGTHTHAPAESSPVWLTSVREGAHLVHEHMLSSTYKEVIVELPTPLAAGESHRFVEVEDLSGHPEFAPLLNIASKSPVESAVIGIQFADVIPSEIWYYENLPRGAGPGKPDAEHMLRADRLGYVSRPFRSPAVDCDSGIGWTWPG
jgi:DNA-binding CsgD family transcriptional regulator